MEESVYKWFAEVLQPWKNSKSKIFWVFNTKGCCNEWVSQRCARLLRCLFELLFTFKHSKIAVLLSEINKFSFRWAPMATSTSFTISTTTKLLVTITNLLLLLVLLFQRSQNCYFYFYYFFEHHKIATFTFITFLTITHLLLLLILLFQRSQKYYFYLYYFFQEWSEPMSYA